MSPEVLRELLRRGEYEIDPHAVADAILARLRSASEDVLVTLEGATGTLEPQP